MVDVDRSPLQYTIFRSVEGTWHRWRFEVRAAAGQLALYRDGEYCFLHALHGERPAGLRLCMRGTAEVPTVVEIGELRVLPLRAAPVRTSAAPQPEERILPGEWPMFRRDRINSAHSPLVGAMGQEAPRVAWSYPLGGWSGDIHPCDLDHDGQQEILVAFEGNLAAYAGNGTQLWKRNVDAPRVYEVCDLDEDGRLELVICAGTPSHVEVLDAATGTTRYACEFDPEYPVQGVRIGKLDPERRGLQIVVWTQHEIGCCLGFESGVENGHVLWTFDYKMMNFTPQVVLADMDRDGATDVVLATYNHFFVYDGRNGRVKMSLEAPLGRNYGLLIVQDIDEDGYPDIVMLAEQLREHVCVVHNERGKSLHLLWDRFYEQDYPVDQKQLRTLPGCVADWDGDGNVEILYGLFDETDGDMWRTLLVDATSGEIKLSLDHHYPLTLDRLPDGRPGVFLVETFGRGRRTDLRVGAVGHSEPSVPGSLKLYSFANGQAHPLIDFPADQLLLRRTWRAFPATEWAMYMDIRAPARRPGEQGLYFVSVSKKGEPSVVRHLPLREDGTTRDDWACTLPSDLPPGSVLDIVDVAETRSGSKDGSQRRVLFAGADASLYILDARGEHVGNIPVGGVIGAPIVADMGASPQLNILVNDAHAQLLCLEQEEQNDPPKLLWAVPSVWTGSDKAYANHGMAVPVAFDWDQDGAKEILLGQPPHRLVIVDARGRIEWSCDLPEAPFFWNYGNLTGTETFDVFVSYSDGFYGNGCQVYAPPWGRNPLWNSSAGAYASAVWDVNGDGREELIIRDLFWRRTLDGDTGRDVFPITQWAGYHVPTIVNKLSSRDEIGVVWTGGNYSLIAETLDGRQVWWKPFMSRWHPGVVADVDGDGRLEIGAVTWGQVFDWPPPLDPVPGLGRAFACLELATGDVKWTYDPGTGMSGVVAADVDGDGLPEFLFGTGDGRLIALRGGESPPERVVFEVQLPAAVGTPVICDPIGEGEMHILVGCADGNLYALK